MARCPLCPQGRPGTVSRSSATVVALIAHRTTPRGTLASSRPDRRHALRRPPSPGAPAAGHGAAGHPIPRRTGRSHPTPRRGPPPAAPGPEDGMGQELRLLHRHPAAARGGSGTDPPRQPPAGAHAQPDRRRGANGRPRRDDQLGQPGRVESRGRGDPRRHGGHPAHLPGTAGERALPRAGAGRRRRAHRAPRHRRGPLHLRLGPRLPPPLPTDRAHRARPAAQPPPAGDHRQRQRPRDGRSRGDSGTRPRSAPGRPVRPNASPGWPSDCRRCRGAASSTR